MALKHAQPMEIIDLHAINAQQGVTVSSSLLKTPRLQLMRVVLATGHGLPEHHVPGEITIHCLSGVAEVITPGRTARLTAGTLVMLSAAEPHAVHAQEDSVLLVTLLHP